MITAVVFLFFSFLAFALFMLLSRKRDLRSERLQARVNRALQMADQQSDSALNLSRDDEMSGSPLLQRLLTGLQPAERLNRMINQADMNLTVSRLLTYCGLAGVVAVLAAWTLFSSALLIALIGLFAAVLPLWHVSRTRKKRMAKFQLYLPDALELMSRSLAAGHAFSESLHLVATEMPEPVATEFRVTYEEQKLGLTLKMALDNLSDRVPVLDLRFCITAILIQRETGGNLAELLEQVAFTIRQRFKIMGELKTLTTGSRASAWMLCALPLGVALLLTVLNPDYMRVLWLDPRGHKLILLALAMQALGILTIRKMIQIKI